MRTFFIVLYLIYYYIKSLFLWPAAKKLGKKDHVRQLEFCQRHISGAFRNILFLAGTKTTVKGLENIPKDQASLFITNHRGYFDILLGYRLIPVRCSYVAKKEMEHMPLIAHWMRLLDCQFLDRENIKEGMKTILNAVELIKSGQSVVISPEGTRNSGDELLPFHEGSFKIATKTGCPIVPVAINNTNTIFEDHFPWIHSAKTCIEFGTPIYPNELTKEQKKTLSHDTRAIIQEMYDKNKKDCI
jgi:1-acyl-sn-glycerol-3-phosphate acyltransferase